MNEEIKSSALNDEDLEQVNGGITLNRLPYNGRRPIMDDLTYNPSQKAELTDLTFRSDSKKTVGGNL